MGLTVDRSLSLASEDISPQVDLRFCRTNSKTRLCRKRVRYPYVVTSALYLEETAPSFPTVVLQSASGGYFEGERLLQRIVVDQHARACVTNQSNTVVHGMPSGDFAECKVELVVAEDGYLEYCPRPIVMFPDSRLRQQISASVAKGAAIVLVDGFLGHDPHGGGGSFAWLDALREIHDTNGRLLAADRTKLSGKEAFDFLPGISRGIYCHGSTIVVAPPEKLSIEALCDQITEQCKAVDGLYIGTSALPGRLGVFVRMAGTDASSINFGLRIAVSSARLQILGFAPFQ